MPKKKKEKMIRIGTTIDQKEDKLIIKLSEIFEITKSQMLRRLIRQGLEDFALQDDILEPMTDRIKTQKEAIDIIQQKLEKVA